MTKNIVTVSVALNGQEIFRNYGLDEFEDIGNRDWQREVESMLLTLSDNEEKF